MADLDVRAAAALPVEQHWIKAGSGREILLWRTGPTPAPGTCGVLLASGLGKTMSHSAALTLYLGRAGFTVFRYDPLDHVGASSGIMEDYTMSSGLNSLGTVVSWIRETCPGISLGLVANSISGRLGYRFVGCDGAIEFLVTGVGVVYLSATLAKALEADFVAMPEAELPDFTLFDGNQINIRSFREDGFAHDWFGRERCIADIARAQVPVVAFSATEDRWVDAGDIRSAMALARHHRSEIKALLNSGHEVGANPAIARAFLNDITATSLDLSGTMPPVAWSEPSFREITRQVVEERRIERFAHPSRYAASEQMGLLQ